MPARWAHSLAFAGFIALAPSSASSQTATALDRFDPAPAGDGFFAVPRADVRGHLRPSATLTFSYAHAPLQLRTYDVASGQTVSESDLVSYQLAAHVLASIELGRRIKLDLDVPLTLAQGGDSPAVDLNTTSILTPKPQSFVSPSGPAMNDMRLGARMALLRQRGLIPAAAVAYSVWFPSGNADAYTSTGYIRHAPSIVFGAEIGRYAWSLTAGRRVQDSRRGTGLIGSEIVGGASFSTRFDKLTAQAELFGSVATTDPSPIGSAKPNMELLVGGRYSFGPLTAGIMAGPGLFRGIGTPTFRVLISIGTNFGATDTTEASTKVETAVRSSETPAKPDSAGASNSHARDPKHSPALAPDRDGDSVADEQDVCPDVSGDATAAAPRRGCPADRDGDSIVDVDDRCPDEKGVATADLERFGCPLDTDGDHFADAVDACPNEKGDANEDPKKNGCPTSVRVEGTQIVILQEVNFATGIDVIRPDSFPLLEQVAAVLKQHPEIARVAVDGHTDNAGLEKANITLSQKRAVAVATWLVDHGIDARRLEARGFGPRRPIASNNTPAGKAKNRRVEFQILKRSAEGSAAWRAGTIQ